MFFTRKFYLRASDFDRYDKITPRAILELFQDVAGNHAENMGIGFNALLEKNLMWVIVRTKFTIIKPLRRYSEVVVKTWPLKPQRLIFRREYLILDESGEIAVRGSADWMIIDSNTRSLASCNDIYPQDAVYSEELALDEKLRKIRDVEGTVSTLEVIPKFNDIDLNGHVNNTKYADFAINTINPSDREIVSFQIDYHKEVLNGEQLKLTAVTSDEKTVVKGENLENDKKFTCEVVFK